MANDSVRFVWDALGYYALTDLAGNKPNPKEKGRRMEGVNPSEIEKILIAELGPLGPDGENKILIEALDSLRNKDYGLLKNVENDSLFNKNKPVALLPALEDWHSSQIKANYPGSVGQLFRLDVDNNISDLEAEIGVTIPADSITFHAKSYYHTNLGNFVAESKSLKLSCKDKIFQINGTGDCRSNGAKSVYLAWNLKDAKDRLVGAGAYVEVYDFYWEVNYRDPSKDLKIHRTFDKTQKKIEMVGVKRVKKKGK